MQYKACDKEKHVNHVNHIKKTQNKTAISGSTQAKGRSPLYEVASYPCQKAKGRVSSLPQ